jgi:hypothetical protein
LKTPGQFNYSGVPGIKASSKLLVKAILRKVYIRPKSKIANTFIDVRGILKDYSYKAYVSRYHMPIDNIIYNKKGIPDVFLVASYTDADKNYLPGMIESGDIFGGIVLYHDKNEKHNFKYNESLRFQLLVAAARKHGAKWVLVGSPKTRFSSEFKSQVKPYIEKYRDDQVVLGLKERYLWEKFDQYAYPKNVEGDAIIYKFFTVTEDMSFDNLPIHASQHPINYKKKVVTTASRYYLGRFNIKTMKKKAEFYNKKDGKDYSYLYDIAKPKKHNETLLGIGEFERQVLLTKD